jgi:hypothetical protein
MVGHMPPSFILENHHEPQECGAVFAAFRGFASELRHSAALASCLTGGHAIWWSVRADDEVEALRQLPPFVAERTRAVRVSEVRIP